MQDCENEYETFFFLTVGDYQTGKISYDFHLIRFSTSTEGIENCTKQKTGR